MSPWDEVQIDGRSKLSREDDAHAIELAWTEISSPRLVAHGRRLVVLSQVLQVIALIAVVFLGFLGFEASFACVAGVVLLLPLATALTGGVLWRLGAHKRPRSLSIDAAGLRGGDGRRLSWDRVQGTDIGSKLGSQAVPKRWHLESAGEGDPWLIAHGILEVEAQAISEVILASRPPELAPADVVAEKALREVLGRDGDGP